MGESNAVSVTVANTVPDREPPTVLILSPVENQEVSGIVDVEMVTSHNVGVERLELFVDGVLMDTATEAPFRCMWDTSRHSNGPHVLEAVAYDAAGQQGSHTTHVTVNNEVLEDAPPLPVITAPISGETVSKVVKVWVYVTDDLGIERVELHVNGTLYQAVSCEGTECNVRFSWNTKRTGKGPSTLQAVAFDSAGNRGQSEEVNVSVD